MTVIKLLLIILLPVFSSHKLYAVQAHEQQNAPLENYKFSILIDELSKLGLLGVASELMESYMLFDKKGSKKPKYVLGAKLADLYMKDSQPLESLRVLNLTEVHLRKYTQKLRYIAIERSRIRAESHFNLGNYMKALEIADTIKTYESNLLKIKIFWEMNDCQTALQTLNEVENNLKSLDNFHDKSKDKSFLIAMKFNCLIKLKDYKSAKAFMRIYREDLAESNMTREDLLEYISD